MYKFEYLHPKTSAEAAELLASHGENSIPYSGGTDVIGLMKTDIVTPGYVVDLKKIGGMNKIEKKNGGLRIGALVTIDEISKNKTIKEKYTVLAEAAGEVASPQLRNVGTIGGNLNQRPRCPYYREEFDCIRKGGGECFAFDGENKTHAIIGGGPCYIVYPSDPAVALLALDAELEIHSSTGTRTVPINEYYILPEDDPTKENILEPGEFVTAVILKEPEPGTVSSYVKFKERQVWDFAIVSVAAVLNKNGNKIKKGKLAYGGVAPKPWEEEQANDILNGLTSDDSGLEKLTASLFTDADPLDHNAYKIPLARNLTQQLLKDLVSK